MQNRSSKPKRPRDFNSLAFQVVGELTGTSETPEEPKDPIRVAAAELGRRGGLKGGKARAAKMSPERRREIAKKAAAARWHDRP